MANSSDDREDVFYFVHGEGSNRVERKMKRAQINTERLASMFEVIPVTTWCDKDQKRICELFFKVRLSIVYSSSYSNSNKLNSTIKRKLSQILD